MTPTEYATVLTAGLPTDVLPTRLFGRLGRVGPRDPLPAQYSSVPGRPIAWLFGEDALAAFCHATPRMMAIRMGKSEQVIQESLRRGEQWYLLVCEAPGAVPATWDSLFRLISNLV